MPIFVPRIPGSIFHLLCFVRNVKPLGVALWWWDTGLRFSSEALSLVAYWTYAQAQPKTIPDSTEPWQGVAPGISGGFSATKPSPVIEAIVRRAVPVEGEVARRAVLFDVVRPLEVDDGWRRAETQPPFGNRSHQFVTA